MNPQAVQNERMKKNESKKISNCIVSVDWYFDQHLKTSHQKNICSQTEKVLILVNF